MDQHLLANLLAWGAQALCLAALGALLPVLLRVESPGARHAFYRVLLALCLALPWLQGRHDGAAGTGGTVATSVTMSVAGVTAPGAGQAGVAAGFPWLTLLGGVLVLGILARLAWMAAGLWRLHRLRAAGYEASPGERTRIEAAVGARAEVRYVPGLSQPVTFGALRPVVLLPEALQSQPVPFARAVLCHELLHVRRRDWLWLLLEEAVRALLWFHPGVWWLISAVQRTREEVVDAHAVRLTGSRRAYAEALAAFAGATTVAPAAAFGQRHHLVRRLRLIAREGGTSLVRLTISCTVLCLLVAAGGWVASGAFPMTVAAQDLPTDMGPLERQARPMTPENPLPRRLSSLDPLYPVEAMGIGLRAVVSQMLTVDAGGRVAEVRLIEERLTGVEAPGANQREILAALRAVVESADRAVRQWVFDAPVDPPVTIRVSFSFAPDEVRLTAFGGTLSTGPGTRAVRQVPPPASGTGTDAAPSRVPGVNAPSGRAGTIAPSAPAEATQEPIRVGGNVRPPTKTRHVNPEYPVIAQSARVQGVVILETLIGTDGTVQNATVLRSIPLLDQAALDAVRQWEFTPTLLNGVAVPVIMTVTVQFSLAD